MTRLLNCFLSAALVSTLLAGCSSDSSSEGPVPPPAGDGNICGYVRCDGRGIAGVVVSDGANVVKTDAEGYYSFTSDLATADFVRISIPSGYETARDGILPTFYAAIDPAEPGTQRFDFDLTAVDNTRHLLLVMADVHISGRKPGYPNDSGTVVAELDAKQCRERFIPALTAHAASAAAGYRVYGLNLGDMTHSEYWYSKNYSFLQYIEAMKGADFPIFHAIGNHDYCHKVADDTADAQYKAALGPTYYSFNLGRIHYIVLDDMVYKGSNAYSPRIDDRQMEWLRKDLAATDPAIRDVVVAMHVPTVNGLQTDGSYKKALENFDEFYALFADYNLTVMSGHWHHAHSIRIGDKAAEYILPAACGTWWYKLLCIDGTPAAFAAWTVNGTSMSHRIVPIGDEYAAERYRVYNKGVTTNTGTVAPGTASDPAGGSPAVLVNLWEMRPDWTFDCYENGVPTSGRLTRVARYDPIHRDFCNQGLIGWQRYSWCATVRTADHWLQYAPADPAAAIRITVTNHKGTLLHVIDTKIE